MTPSLIRNKMVLPENRESFGLLEKRKMCPFWSKEGMYPVVVTRNALKVVTFHRKTYTNDFPLNWEKEMAT